MNIVPCPPPHFVKMQKIYNENKLPSQKDIIRKMSIKCSSKRTLARKPFSSIDGNSVHSISSLKKSDSKLSKSNRSSSSLSLASQSSLASGNENNKSDASTTETAAFKTSSSVESLPLEKTSYKKETCDDYEYSRFKASDVSSIFRRSPSKLVMSDDMDMMVLRRAAPIHEKLDKEIIARQGDSVVVHLMNTHRVPDFDIMPLFCPEESCKDSTENPTKIDSHLTKNIFREAPNKKFLTEEMEMMLELKIANAIDEDSGSESEFSV